MANELISIMSDEMLKAYPSSATAASQVPKSRTGSTAQESTVMRPVPVPALLRRLTAPMVRVVDLVALTTGLFLTLYSLPLSEGQAFASFLQLRVSIRNLFLEIGLLLVWRVIFWMVGLYQPRLNRSLATFFWKIPMATLFCMVPVLPLLRLSHEPLDMTRSVILFWCTSSALMVATRVAVYSYEERIRPTFRRKRTVLICGTGVRARLLTMQLPEHPDYRYQLAGFIDSDPQAECSRIAPVLGSVSEMESILMRLPVDEVMVALPIKTHFAEIEDIVGICGRAGIQLQYSLELFTTDIAKNHSIDSAEGNRVVVEMVHTDHRLMLKTTFDRILSTIGLVILSPVFLLIALMVKLTSKGPVFFVQQRYGLGKRKFGMIKFRTMVQDAEAKQAALEHMNEIKGPMFKIKRDPRITRVGALLRRTSLDELPQLINVLKGDMSLVGPRPLPSRDVDRFSEAWLMRRFSVKPGITGLWQVSGRSDSDFDNVIKLDLRYIDRWSLLLDIKILFRTVAAVAKGRGAY